MSGFPSLLPGNGVYKVSLQEVTGTEDLSGVRVVLENHGWDLEAAVQYHLAARDSPTDAPPTMNAVDDEDISGDGWVSGGGAEVGTRNGDIHTFQMGGRVSGNNGTVVPLHTRFFNWSCFLLLWPVRFTYSTLTTLFSFICHIINPFPRRLGDPLRDVLSFFEEYESEYGSQHPSFFQGTYSQALSHAKSQLKFLLVYLHCSDHQDTPHFCRTTLSDPSVVAFLNNSLVFWGCSVTTAEGYRVSQVLRENSYPFLALIVLRENRMTVVGRLEGTSSPEQFIQRVQSLMRDNEAYLVIARTERQDRELTAALRREQDVAFEQSLQADREKERQRQQEREEIERKENEIREQEAAVTRERDNIRRLKVEMVDQIPEEPDESSEGVLHIVVKLPQGSRLERRFLQTHSLKCLYYYIFCHPDSPDRFTVTTNFPRKVVPCEPDEDKLDPQTFQEFGLTSRTMLFVSDLDA
ncbi:unnamed protein product, partial [Meganyctiphanes norvegica]